jgi:hypothetical protein
MANTLSKAGITTGGTVETWHVTQSIDAFTATEAYDISISGSLAVTEGSTTLGIGTIASASFQTVVGQYNTQGDNKSPFIVGLGADNANRKDVFKVTTQSSIQIPITRSITPQWSGSDGEIVPATVGGKYLLYMWMNGAWRSGSFV